MSLREYQRKRHFHRTPEPEGKRSISDGRSFVIQKHAASRLHYDFRLELGGVLKSWAVPKGPSLDPTVKRLAMQVEDHPVEYGTFEGIIPAGEYGGGTVMLWDQGQWEPVGDPDEGYQTGKLKFRLHGQKLRGGWMLVRTHSNKGRQQWLLFKERDDEAKAASDGDVLEELPLSVETGRDMRDIAVDRDWVWGKQAKPKKTKKTVSRPNSPLRAKRSHPQRAVMPAKIDVELATRTDKPPKGDEWLHEVKFDGYRIICRIDSGQVSLISRNHKDWTERFATIANSATSLPVTQAIFDGEVVVLRSDGVTDFQQLQNAARDHREDLLHYFIFDLLYFDGQDLTQTRLDKRKEILARILHKRGIPKNVHLSDHVEGNGPAFLREACKKGLEGIVSKRRDQPYSPGRGTGWLKMKCIQTDEFVIGGYTDPAGERIGLGALLVGYHNPRGDLVYAGKVGTGYDERTLKALLPTLQALGQENSPFKDHQRAPRGTHWVAPTLVGQFAFGSRTHDGILRHASFQGLREDKSPQEVTFEKPLALTTTLRKEKTMTKAARLKAPRSSPARNSDVEYDSARQQFAGVRLTSPDKVLYPEQGITKLELANYYRTMADWILPHIADRPLVLVRCPEGYQKECFFQKHPGMGTPGTLRLVSIKEKTKTERYVVVDDVAGLISLAQVGVLEIHAWGSRADKLEAPDRLIFDLDPDPQLPWARVVRAARQVREFLQQLGLESFVKTTGGKGLHLVVPIQRRRLWDEVKTFCKQVADAIVRADPDSYTANLAKAARHGKIYIDFLRNGRGATAVVPYSPRARAGAPIATPLTWEELSPNTHADQFTIKNILKRLESLKRDPWDSIASIRQSLNGPIKVLRNLIAK
jgi:bifunctional non-homologous end joining protein LigD